MKPKNLVTLEIAAARMNFSAGHFTIFSATEREPLHGHNYTVRADITAAVDQNGITLNYQICKEKVIQLCKQLNSYFLLPTQSPYLRIEDKGDYYHTFFNEEMIPFLKKDIKLLDVKNVTLEELSRWFVEQLLTHSFIDDYNIQSLSIKIYNGTGQAGCLTWNRNA